VIPLPLLAFAGKLGIPEPLRKVAVIGTAVVLLIALLAIGKCSYDRSIIKAHEAKQEAATAKADRKADTHAAEQRRADDARSTTEAQQIKEAVNEARRNGADPRAAYYDCVRKQQSARKSGKPSPGC
jgi:Tfp pilus assembly protein PilE